MKFAMVARSLVYEQYTEDPPRKLMGASASVTPSQSSGVLEILISLTKKLIWSGGLAVPSDKH